jgi:hypothetical protein
LNQKLSDWASIAEILGAVAIVISLIFVGLQISEGNSETRAATTQAALDAEMLFQSELIRNADIWLKVIVQGDMSDAVETQKAVALMNMAMTLQDNRYQMMSAGYLEYPEESMRATVRIPFFDTWRKSQGARGRSPKFLEFADYLRGQVATE